MANNVHLILHADGKLIQGESEQTSDGRKDTIECLYLESGVSAQQQAGKGQGSGKRNYAPILIRKKIDKSTPLITKALCGNETIKATFKFYRPHPVKGELQQFFTIDISDARVASQDLVVPDETRGGAGVEPMETITFTSANCRWVYTEAADGSGKNVSHVDTYDGQDVNWA